MFGIVCYLSTDNIGSRPRVVAKCTPERQRVAFVFPFSSGDFGPLLLMTFKQFFSGLRLFFPLLYFLQRCSPRMTVVGCTGNTIWCKIIEQNIQVQIAAVRAVFAFRWKMKEITSGAWCWCSTRHESRVPCHIVRSDTLLLWLSETWPVLFFVWLIVFAVCFFFRF